MRPRSGGRWGKAMPSERRRREWRLICEVQRAGRRTPYSLSQCPAALHRHEAS